MNLTAELLHASRPLTAEEIRGRMASAYPAEQASFRRSFERDKADLRAIGIPIRSSPAPGTDPPIEGYRIQRGEYAGRDPALAPDELAALHLAASLVRLEGGVGGAFTKLGGPLAEPGDDELDGADDGGDAAAVGAVPFDEPLAALVEGAARRRVAAFAYNGEARTVEPWKLSFSRGHWYLSGWDRDREAERIFRVDRMAGPVTLGGPAVHAPPPAGHIGPLLGWELGDAEPVEARVSVVADPSTRACHVTGADGEPRPDGSVVLTLKVRNPDAFRSLVLSFLDRAEVLGPEELRLDVIDWLEALTGPERTR